MIGIVVVVVAVVAEHENTMVVVARMMTTEAAGFVDIAVADIVVVKRRMVVDVELSNVVERCRYCHSWIDE